MSTAEANKYNIQLASRISGVGVHTIRAWEKRYQAVVPARNPSGRREYSDKDVERLSLLSELCTLGHTIGKIANTPTEELKKLIKQLGGHKNQGQGSNEQLPFGRGLVDIPSSLKSLIMALKMYKLDIISHELNKLKLLLDSRQLALEIVSPLLREVGFSVDRGELSISQEHALSAILKFHIGHILFRGNMNKSTKPYRFIISTIEGDYHEFGILQAALLCNHYQLDYVFLGPNLPIDSLVDSFHSLEGSHVLLGSTVVPDGKDEKFVSRYINSAVRRIEHGKVLIGGGPHVEAEKYQNKQKTDFFSTMGEFDAYLKSL